MENNSREMCIIKEELKSSGTVSHLASPNVRPEENTHPLRAVIRFITTKQKTEKKNKENKAIKSFQ